MLKRVIVGHVVKTAEHGIVLSNCGYKRLLRGDKFTKFSWEIRIANYSDHNFGMTEVIFEFMNVGGWIVFKDKALAFLGPNKTVNVGNTVSMSNALAVEVPDEVQSSNVVLRYQTPLPEPKVKLKPPTELK